MLIDEESRSHGIFLKCSIAKDKLVPSALVYPSILSLTLFQKYCSKFILLFCKLRLHHLGSACTVA